MGGGDGTSPRFAASTLVLACSSQPGTVAGVVTRVLPAHHSHVAERGTQGAQRLHSGREAQPAATSGAGEPPHARPGRAAAANAPAAWRRAGHRPQVRCGARACAGSGCRPAAAQNPRRPTSAAPASVPASAHGPEPRPRTGHRACNQPGTGQQAVFATKRSWSCGPGRGLRRHPRTPAAGLTLPAAAPPDVWVGPAHTSPFFLVVRVLLCPLQALPRGAAPAVRHAAAGPAEGRAGAPRHGGGSVLLSAPRL